MDRDRWKRVLGKFKNSELPQIAVDELGLELPPFKTKNKKELVSLIVDRCIKANLTPSDILKLELSLFCSNPNSVLWKAYRVRYADPTALSKAALDAEFFAKRLQCYLGDVYDYHMVQLTKPLGCWLCMHIADNCLAPYTCYIFRQPPSPVLFLAGVRKTHLVTLLEALCLTLNSVSYKEVDLTSKNLLSLLELVCNQHSQGPLSSYRLNQVDPNPLLVAGRHMPLPSPEDRSQEEEEKESSVAKRHKASADTFGTNPLPTLEKFTFKLSTSLPNESDVISCQVRLSGSSVLEGTKAAIAEGCISLPVPEVISRMASFASNSLDVKEQ